MFSLCNNTPSYKVPFFLSLLVNDDVVVHQTMTNNYLFSRELSTTTTMSFLLSLCINIHNFQVCLFVCSININSIKKQLFLGNVGIIF